MSRDAFIVSAKQKLALHIGIVRGSFIPVVDPRDEEIHRRVLEKFVYESVGGAVWFVFGTELDRLIDEEGYVEICKLQEIPETVTYEQYLARGATTPT